EFRAAVAHEHHALRDARRAGYRIGFTRRRGLHRPHFLAGFGVERDQAVIDGAYINLAFPYRNAAIHHVTTGIHCPLSGYLRIVKPDQLARPRVIGTHLAPRSGNVNHTVDHDWRGSLPPVRVEVGKPCQTQPVDIVLVDLRQRTEALLTVGAAIREPVLTGFRFGNDAVLV